MRVKTGHSQESEVLGRGVESVVMYNACVVNHVSRVCLCNPMDCSTPGSSVHGILQPRILEWDAVSSSSRSSQARDQIHTCCSSGTSGGSLTSEPLEKADNVKTGYCLKALTLCLAHTQTVSCKSLQNIRSECDRYPHTSSDKRGTEANACPRLFRRLFNPYAERSLSKATGLGPCHPAQRKPKGVGGTTC